MRAWATSGSHRDGFWLYSAGPQRQGRIRSHEYCPDRQSSARQRSNAPGPAPRMEIVMQSEPTPKKPSPPMLTTATPGIYSRCGSFSVKWREEDKVRWRTFPTYEAAVAFKRDYVIPYRNRRALPPTAIMPNKSETGWVYAFQSRDGIVKIGWSKDPARRKVELATGHPYPLELVALIPGAKSLEGHLHKALAQWNIGREWFSPEALDEIVQMLGKGMNA